MQIYPSSPSTSSDECEDPLDLESYKLLVRKTEANKKWHMRIKLKSTALVSDRFGLSDRAIAAVASSLLEDVGLITTSDVHLTIDRSKVRREKKQQRANLQTESHDQVVTGSCFDGRKDNTLYVEEAYGKRF